ncbi:MAG: MopE-related protein [bacterium]
MMRGPWFALAALVALMAPAAAQQRQKARVLLIFDTSGSMGVDVATGLPTGGDNSAEYPGNGGTSRLFVAKEVVTGLLSTQSEVEFALMRYPQIEGEDINRGAVDGRQNNSYEGLLEDPLDYAGECAGRLYPGGAGEASSLLVPFGEDNEGALIEWMNHREQWPVDRELRAEGPTPIAESLRLAAEYLLEAGQADAGARCRQTAVVLLTDGGESCVPPAERAAALVARAEALRGLAFEAGGEAVEQEVRTFVLAYAVNQRALDELSLLARAGGTAVDRAGELDLVAGGAYEARDLASLRRAFNAIIREAIPTERCNGEDDDCDGVVDEGVQNACGRCGPTPAEVCDGVDDDCDGRIDEGALNACGRCGPPPPEACNGVDDDCDGAVDEAVQNACGGCVGVREEVCNGRDDDCDGVVDNRPLSALPLARACSSDLGACRAGVELCVGGAWAACDGVVPREERCDGADDDCDGLVDERALPCGAEGDVGECRVGRRRCDPAACAADAAACGADGWLAACEDAVGPAVEVCNGRDDDCDGELDEGLINACGMCGAPPPEACNGVDDNCDGRVDDDARCPTGYACLAGECAQPCGASGECRPGFTCVNAWPGARYCHPDPCAAAWCPAGTRCDAAAGGCVDPCRGVVCGEGEGCDLGACVPATCRHEGCAAGERCLGDVCEADPCAEVMCDEGEFCREGGCVAACRGVVCGAGQACVDGVCALDPCEGRCLRGARCDPVDGACVADPCAEVACPAGMACVGGECRADAACVALRCPTGTTCVEGRCTDFTPGVDPRFVVEPDAAVPDAGVADAGVEDRGVVPDAGDAAVDMGRLPSGDGGDGCGQAPGQGAGGAALIGLLLLVGWRRARMGC